MQRIIQQRQLGNPQPAPDVARALALLDDLPRLLAAATPTERRAVLRQLFSHVYVEQRDIKAVTPKGVYVPLLGEIIARQTTKQDATGAS